MSYVPSNEVLERYADVLVGFALGGGTGIKAGESVRVVAPVRIMRRGVAMRKLLDWRGEKENQGRFTWTLGLYGTPAMAAEAGLDEQAYWEQIIHACFLDDADPIARWREVQERIERTRE